MTKIPNEYALGIDIGGSHITAAIVNINKKMIVASTKNTIYLDASQNAQDILNIWIKCIENCLQNSKAFPILGVGISLPGPTNYEKGITELIGNDKYEKLFGVDLRNYLFGKLRKWIDDPSKITFVNDANGFLLGETWSNNMDDENIMGITLGTGIGSGFMQQGKIISKGNNIPKRGEVYNLPFKGKTGEEWISTRWFLKTYKNKIGSAVNNVKEIADQAESSVEIRQIFEDFGENLGNFLAPILKEFDANTLVLGGNITRSYTLFQSSFEKCFHENMPKIHFASDTEDSAILGAVKNLLSRSKKVSKLRLSQQHIMPISYDFKALQDSYNIYPSFEIEKGKIELDYQSLAKEIADCHCVCIDGYIGVDWSDFISNLTKALEDIEVQSIAYSMSSAFKESKEIDLLISDFLGGDDPVFGKLFPGELSNFIELEKLENIEPDSNCLSILYGCGAALSLWDAKTIYVDIPKNELQYRSRAGKVLNLGAETVLPPKVQYKRMFYVDWQVLNKHKQTILKNIDYFVDAQRIGNISWCNAATLFQGLQEMSKNTFRVRPWFEPGIWGGDWIKKNIHGLNKDVINYAWSFEFIVPENGIVFSKNGIRLEVSFDMLMYYDNKAILGDAAKVFGYDMPIRFDFLDTFNGQNLSLQCHPKPDFIKEEFGEKFTQDETYYMLDTGSDAEVYLGFQEDIDRDEFHQALLKSNEQGKAIDVKKYVQIHPAKKHDLFLIPHGTIHCSGKNAMVLEISNTPYIYTFKMYDWMRKDLDGNPRPLNIARAMQNLDFDCKGKKVLDDYISKNKLIEQGQDWKIIQLKTHAKHFYDIFRLEFKNELNIETNDQCHILSLVEGEQIEIITANRSLVVNFAETFVVPANTKNYQLINLGTTEVKVIQSFVKPKFCNTEQ